MDFSNNIITENFPLKNAFLHSSHKRSGQNTIHYQKSLITLKKARIRRHNMKEKKNYDYTCI